MKNKGSRLLILRSARGMTEKEYGELYAALGSLGAKPIQESVWVVRTESCVAAVLRELQGCLAKGIVCSRLHWRLYKPKRNQQNQVYLAHSKRPDLPS